MKHIFALACAIFLLTFSPYLLANQVLLIGSGCCRSTDVKLVGPAFKDTATEPCHYGKYQAQCPLDYR